MTDDAPYGWLVVKPPPNGRGWGWTRGYIRPDEPPEAPDGCILVPLPGWLNVKRGLVDYIAMRERREVYRRYDEWKERRDS